MKLHFKKPVSVTPNTNFPKTRQLNQSNRQIRTIFFSLIGIVLLGLVSNLAYAVPMMTNYQGYLVDTSGNPLNATVTMTFALYDIPEGGTPLWTETYPNVVVTKGIFSVVLGSVVNFTAADIEGERYLGVTVGTDEEMLPRHALTSTLSSIWAGVAESVTNGAVGTENIAESAVTSGKVANDAITTEKIADKAVTGAKIADLSGHSATELNDITSVGSGAIITTEEREKLKNLTSGVPSAVTNLTVEQQLKVGDKIKVGKNSLWLGTHDTGRDNSIWTTPSQNGRNQLAIQSYGNDGDTIINDSSAGNVGIGTNAPQEKLHVDGSVFLEPGIPPFPITDNRLYNQGGELYWGGNKVAIFNDITGIIEDDPQVGNNTPNFIPKWDGSALVSGTIYDEDGKVGIGINSTPNEKLHVNGAIFLDHTSPPTDTRYRLYNNNGDLYWDGSPLGGTLPNETDPTVPANLKDGVSWTEVADKPTIISTETDPTVPNDLKDGVSWTEVADKPTIISTETDPTVPANLKDGVSWSEVANKPPIISSETDPTVPANLKDGVSWAEVANKPTIISSEDDPQVGNNTANYVPRWDGNALVTGSISDSGNGTVGTNVLEANWHISKSNAMVFNVKHVELGGWGFYFRSYDDDQKFPKDEHYRDLMRITSVGDVLIGIPEVITKDSPDWKKDDFVVKSGGGIGFGGHIVNYNKTGAFVLYAGPNTTIGLDGKEVIGLDGKPASSNLGGFWFRAAERAGYPGVSKELMRITADGNVGIGTTEPAGKLDVHGNIHHYGSLIHSDKRWKKNITPLENSLEKVSKLQGVNYQWDTENYPKMEFNEEKQIGFIAQDVEPVIPELVSTNSNGYKSVAYDKMTAVLVEAVKELKAQNDALKAIICEDHPEKAICQ